MVQSIADDFLIEGDDATFGATTHESVSTDSAYVEGPLDGESVSATTELSGPTASEGDVVTLPEDPHVVPIFFDAQTGQPLVPDLEETV